MYLLDANVFITAKNTHYGLDFAPAFWDWIAQAHAGGTVFTIDEVKKELDAGADELKTWAKAQPASFFVKPDATTTPYLKPLSDWVNASDFTPAAKAEFLNSPDYFLVAQARGLGYTLVTHEKSEPESKKKVKIPDACIALGVRSCLPWPMLRAEQAKFVL